MNKGIESDVRWLTIAQAARLTGLSDETLRKYCAAKVHFPNAQFVGDRWEVPDKEVRAAKIIDRSLIVARTRITEQRLTQLERLGRLTSSSEDKFSLDQEVYLQDVKGLEELASAPSFVERAQPVPPHRGASPSETEALPTAVHALPVLSASEPVKPFERAIVIVQPGIPVADRFVAYMTGDKDPSSLPDECFAGDFALEFIPPVGIEYHVALGPIRRDDGSGGTWVRRYPSWTCDDGNLECVGETEFFVEGLVCERGSVPDAYAASSAQYTLLRGVWRARAVEARARLRSRAREAGLSFLPDFVWRPDVRTWIRRYQEERLHPRDFPDSVKAALVDVPFMPVFNMFYYESTGEVRSCRPGSLLARDEYTVVSVTSGFSDEFGWGEDMSPEAPLRAELMWPGRHSEGDVPPWSQPDNAEYLAWAAAWEDMQQEGRRISVQRHGE